MPAADCGCGYWIARHLPTLGAVLPALVATGALLPGGVAQALVRVQALGTAAGVMDQPGVPRVESLAYGGQVVLHQSVARLAARVAARFGGIVNVSADLFAYSAATQT